MTWLDEFARRSKSTPKQWDAIAALLPIEDKEQRRRCLTLCFQKVRWYWLTCELEAQGETPHKAAKAELSKLAQQLQKARATLCALVQELEGSLPVFALVRGRGQGKPRREG